MKAVLGVTIEANIIFVQFCWCFHWSSHRFSLLMLSLKFHRQVNSWCENDTYSKHSLHICYFILWMSYFPAKCTLYNTVGNSWQNKKRQHDFPLRKEAKHMCHQCNWDLCMEHALVMSEKYLGCGNWSKYFCGRLLFVLHCSSNGFLSISVVTQILLIPDALGFVSWCENVDIYSKCIKHIKNFTLYFIDILCFCYLHIG